MITSEWLEYNFELDNSLVFYTTIPAPELTQEILDKGAIKMYIGVGNKVYDIPSPYWDGLYPEYTVGEINLYSIYDWDSGTRNYRVRYVLIPSE